MLNKTVSLCHFIESILCALLVNQFFQNCQSAKDCAAHLPLWLPTLRRPTSQQQKQSNKRCLFQVHLKLVGWSFHILPTVLQPTSADFIPQITFRISANYQHSSDSSVKGHISAMFVSEDDLLLFLSLILFSVQRTDRSNAKFATFSLGKTDNARRRQAAEILLPSLLDA